MAIAKGAVAVRLRSGLFPVDGFRFMLAFDAASRQKRQESRRERDAFEHARRAEYQYAAAIRRVCKHIEDIIKGFQDSNTALTPDQLDQLTGILTRYAKIIKPWAAAVAKRMLHEVARRNERAWKLRIESMGQAMRKEIYTAPIGTVVAESLARQVDLITSLPTAAAERVQNLAVGNLYTGARYSVIAEEIMATGLVMKSRANLIARTEVARASTEITKARAEYIGSPGYIWRTVGDEVVRPSILLPPAEFARLNTFAKGSHRKLNGTFHRWDTPPISGQKGERSHPGCIYNCRCTPEPIIPDVLT